MVDFGAGCFALHGVDEEGGDLVAFPGAVDDVLLELGCNAHESLPVGQLVVTSICGMGRIFTPILAFLRRGGRNYIANGCAFRLVI